MKTSRLISQLRREAKANPKKAALLGGLGAVGIYFWAPLVSQWISPAETAAVNKAQTDQRAVASADGNTGDASNAGGSPEPSKEGSGQGGQPPLAWREAWATIRDDARMKPAGELATSANPFEIKKEPKYDSNAGKEDNAGAAQQAAAARARAAGRTPQGLGMKLTATLIGRSGRLAVIDGEVVREGSTVVAGGAAGKESNKAASGTAAAAGEEDGDAKADERSEEERERRFELVRVESHLVVLKRDGVEFVLELETRQLEGKNKLQVIATGGNAL